MDGLRAAPMFMEMCRRDPDFAKSYDCRQCKSSVPVRIRQSRGCGYEPRIDPARLTVWQPPSAGYAGPDLTTCPGYACNLSEVTEAVVARIHWSKGNLAAIEHNEDLRDAIGFSIAPFAI